MINFVENKKKKKQRSTKKGEKKSFGVHFEVGVHFGALGHAFKSVAHDQIKEEKHGPKEEKRGSNKEQERTKSLS